MENSAQDASPLAAFPNEHPLSPQLNNQSPYKRLLIGIVGVACLVLMVYGGHMMFTKQQNSQKVVSSVKAVFPPKVVVANATTYTNKSYAYQLSYNKTLPSTVADTKNYGYTEFANGCMKIYVAPTATMKTIPTQKNDIPWDQIADLETLPIGQTKNCSILTFTFASDGHAIVNKNDYKRLNNADIAHQSWYAFEVKNGSDTTTHNVFFTKRNTNTYVVETKTGGSCPATLSSDMLQTFSFTK